MPEKRKKGENNCKEKILSFEELEKIDATELNSLAKKLGRTNMGIKTFSLKQKIAFVHGKMLMAETAKEER